MGENSIIFYDFIATGMSFAIIINFLASTFYGIKFIANKNFVYFENKFLYWLKTAVSFLWACAFIYIVIKCLLGQPIFDHKSFGAIFLRPLVLLTSVGAAISQKIRYERTIKGGDNV